MKKVFNKAALVSVLLGVASAFTACNDDSGTIIGGGQTDTTQIFTINGKLLNGTTMTPIHTGEILTLNVKRVDVVVKSEDLGQCRVQPDGSFNVSYKYNKLAASPYSEMKLLSFGYISGSLPKNQDLDKVFYESTEGSVNLSLKTSASYDSSDTLYLAYSNLEEAKGLVFDSIPLPFNGLYKQPRFVMPGQYNVFYTVNKSLKRMYDGDGFVGNPRRASLRTPQGDPFVDDLTIEY